MTGLLIFLIVIFLLWWLWPIISRAVRAWVMRKLQRKAEDYIRRATGMPPHDSTNKNTRSQRQESSKSGAQAGGNSSSRRTRGYHNTGSGPLIPKEYAVDVEYTEIKDYSETTVIADDGQGDTRVWHESQVSDAEWVEIKDSDKSES